MKTKQKITQSLSILASPGRYPGRFEQTLKAMSDYIRMLEKMEIKYSLKNNAVDFPIERDQGTILAAYNNLLTQYALDLKAKQITFTSLDGLKNYLKKKINHHSQYLQISDFDKIFQYIIEDSIKKDHSRDSTLTHIQKLYESLKKAFFSTSNDTAEISQNTNTNQSNVAKYLKSLGVNETTTKPNFSEYAILYKKVYIDNVSNVMDDQFLNSFKLTFENLARTFDLHFVEDNNDYALSIVIKKHLHALEYEYKGDRTSILEKCDNNYIEELLSKIKEQETYPIQILVNHEEFEKISIILGAEPSTALKKETATHEVLHALGLSHPQNGEEIHYTQNRMPCTIMESQSDDRHLNNIFFESIGPNDIVALESHGYRIKEKPYQDNTTITLGVKNHPKYRSITTLIDRDGYNTLDTSLHTGNKEVYINLSYGCSNPSIVGNELYFLDYDSKFNAVKTGSAPHKIEDRTNHDMDFFLGEGLAKIKIYNKTGHKVIYNFDNNMHKVLVSPSLVYQTDEQGNCVGSMSKVNNFSITFNEQSCEEIGLGGAVSERGSEL